MLPWGFLLCVFAISAFGSSVAKTTLLWSDEFNGPAGRGLDINKWRHERGDGSKEGIPGWGNNQLQCYSDSPDNVALDGLGNLVITARSCTNASDPDLCSGNCKFTSARIVTSCGHKYGRIQVRMKLPAGKGLWPAIWMLGDDVGDVGWPKCGSIDVAQFKGNEPGTVISALHGPLYPQGIDNKEYAHSLNASDYHVYAIDWKPDVITWSVDDEVFAKQTKDGIRYQWVFDHPFHIIINLAVGGDFVGSPDDSTKFPSSLVIDYVQVYSNGGKQSLNAMLLFSVAVMVTSLSKTF